MIKYFKRQFKLAKINFKIYRAQKNFDFKAINRLSKELLKVYGVE